MTGIRLSGLCLSGWDLSGLNLSQGDLGGIDLTSCDMSQTLLGGADLRGASFVYSRQVGQAILPRSIRILKRPGEATARIAVSDIPSLDDAASTEIENVASHYPRESFSTPDGYSQYAYDVVRGMATLGSLPANRGRLLTPAMEEVYKWAKGVCRKKRVGRLFLRILRLLTEDASQCIPAAASVLMSTTMPVLKAFSRLSDMSVTFAEDVSSVLFNMTKKGEELEWGHKLKATVYDPLSVATRIQPSSYSGMIARMISSGPVTHNLLGLFARSPGVANARFGGAQPDTWSIVSSVVDEHGSQGGVVLYVTAILQSTWCQGETAALTAAFSAEYLSAVSTCAGDAAFCRDFLDTLYINMDDGDLPPSLPPAIQEAQLVATCLSMMQIHKDDAGVAGLGAAIIGQVMYKFPSAPELVVSIVNAVMDVYVRHPENEMAAEGLVLLGGSVFGEKSPCADDAPNTEFSEAVVAATAAILEEREYARLAVTCISRHRKANNVCFFAWETLCHYGMHCGVGLSDTRGTLPWLSLVPQGLVEALGNMADYFHEHDQNLETHCAAFVVRTLCCVLEEDVPARSRLTRKHLDGLDLLLEDSESWIDRYDGTAPRSVALKRILADIRARL
ncbi:hypothetical protein KIPB_010549 [Kipferlia bialata]|uniref:Uncharacterized protein n=1 Tax=Kipferlia bialata TaxID=797122 RepID=A0A9K3D6R4_9EUKA|nr:hypothetical protein KIPB_010549 [Kipferlia bialata]|eukprot:g10549.t1